MRYSIMLCIAVAMLLCFPHGMVLAQHEQLLAPPPPDAVLYGSESGHTAFSIPGRGFRATFHTPLPVEEVVAFYTANTAPLEELDPGKHYKAHLIEVTFKQPGVLKVHDAPRRPGVAVKDIRQMESRQCASEYFRPFRDMYRDLDQYDRRDFRALCEQYGHIEHAYFGPSDQTGPDGRPVTRDRILHREYVKRLDTERGETATMEEVMEEAQRLMQQGKMEEAAALMEQIAEMQQQAMSRDIERMQTMERPKVEDRWEEWLEFLRELDALAYPTIVNIDYHPAHWPDDDWLHESIEW